MGVQEVWQADGYQIRLLLLQQLLCAFIPRAAEFFRQRFCFFHIDIAYGAELNILKGGVTHGVKLCNKSGTQDSGFHHEISSFSSSSGIFMPRLCLN